MLNKPNTPNESTNIRDHLANERTFLAWIRTSLGIMAFGFVVEKFSLFLKEIAAFLGKPHLAHTPQFLTGSSNIFGIVLVALGALICLLAFLKFLKIENQIAEAAYKPSTKLNTMLALSILLIGILLVVYLIISL